MLLWKIFSPILKLSFRKKFYVSVYLAMSDLINSCGMWDLHCIMWDILLQCGLSSCMWAQSPQACVIIVPWPGIRLTSPALQGGFLPTGPQGIKKISLQCQWVFCLFSSKSLRVFGLTFGCLNHFEFICVVLWSI